MTSGLGDGGGGEGGVAGEVNDKQVEFKKRVSQGEEEEKEKVAFR